MATEVFAKLREAGWFEGWPEGSVERAEKHVGSMLTGDEMPADPTVYPGVAMISVYGDAECIYDEDAYTTLIHDFSEGSFGLFEPDEVKEVWTKTDDAYTIDLSFKFNGKTFSRQIDYGEWGKWIADDFFELLEEALADKYPVLTVYCPDSLFGQDYGFAYVSKGCLESNDETKLLPEFQLKNEECDDEVDDEDEDETCAQVGLLAFDFGDDAGELGGVVYGLNVDGLKSYLLDGGDPNCKDEMFESVLLEHVVSAASSRKSALEDVRRRAFEMLDLLIQHGADVALAKDIADDMAETGNLAYYDKLKSIGWSPSSEKLEELIELAQEEGQKEMVALLKRDFG